MKEIEQIFKLLGEWRKLPKYQLERRLDIFLALYLPQILKSRIGEFSHDDIIPEFPLRKKNTKYYLSNNADYAVLHKENDKVKLYLIELKTDKDSVYRKKQIEYYNDNRNFKEILEGITDIQKNTTQKRYKTKYNALLEKLEDYGLVKKCENAEEWEVIKSKIVEKVELIYLIPEYNDKIGQELINIDKKNIITFEKIIEILGDNVISTEFKKLLRNIIGE